MTIRKAAENDLEDLLTLYTCLIDDEDFSDASIYSQAWKEILNDKKMECWIVYEGNTAVASCIITVIPNLTRNRRPYAVIENVVTHRDFRNKGYGRAVMEKAVETAKENNCYKVMLLSSAKRKEAHEFYRRIGFDGDSKKGFQLRLP